MLLTNGAHAVFFAYRYRVTNQTNQSPVSSLNVQQHRLKQFGHIARAAASGDHSRALRASTDRLPVDWRRPRGRPRQSWLRTIESELKPLNLGLRHSALRRATDRPSWRSDASWKRLCSSSVPPDDDDDETAVGDIHQPFFYQYNTFENLTEINVNAVQWRRSQVLSEFWYLFPILQHKNFQHANSDNIRHEIAMQRNYQRIRQSEGIIPSSKSGDLSPVGCTPCSEPRTPMTIHTHTQLHS